jgi:hypothetical protein
MSNQENSTWDTIKGVIGGIAFIGVGIGLSVVGLANPDDVLNAGGAGSGKARALGGIISACAHTIGVYPTVLGASAIMVALGALALLGSVSHLLPIRTPPSGSR